MSIRTLAIMAALVTGTPASAQDDFEAALAANRPAPRVTSAAAPAGGYVRTMWHQQPPALPRVIPARWRTLKRYPFLDRTMQDALEEDVSAGRLDPAALMRQIAGDIAVPPGTMPAGCARSAEFLLFTFGEHLSPAYAALYAERRKTDPRELADRAFIDAKATRDRVTRFFLSHGYRQTVARDRTAFIDEVHRLRADFYDHSANEQMVCGYEPKDLKLPTGPILKISHSNGLQLYEMWKDGGVSRMTD